jgi:hypothetical protein
MTQDDMFGELYDNLPEDVRDINILEREYQLFPCFCGVLIPIDGLGMCESCQELYETTGEYYGD